jgi:hypothetical protein
MSKTHITFVKPMSQVDSGSSRALSDENANLPDGNDSVLYVASVNPTTLGIAHPAIKRSSSFCFEQKAVALIRSIRFVYLFNY